MLTRLALENEEDKVVELARAHYAELQPEAEFDEERARRTFELYLCAAHPTIFVVEHKREIVGFLIATIHDYAAKDGHFTRQEVIYVRPDKRGTRAAAKLIEHFYSWSDTIGASECFTGLAVNDKLERNIRFMERFGFEHVGVTLRRVKGAK